VKCTKAEKHDDYNLEATSMLTGALKYELKSVVDWTLLHVLFFLSCLMNFVYRNYLEALVFYEYTKFIRVADRMGLSNMYIVRFTYQILFNASEESALDVLKNNNGIDWPEGTGRDTLLLLCLIMPLFIFSLDFFAWSMYEPYKNNYIVWIVPFVVPVFFYCTSGDIAILALHTLLVNLYVVYYVCTLDEADFYRNT
jgi:hypothetical protein